MYLASNVCMYVYMHAYVCVCVRAHAHVCMYVCVCMRAYVYMYVSIHTCIPSCMSVLYNCMHFQCSAASVVQLVQAEFGA